MALSECSRKKRGRRMACKKFFLLETYNHMYEHKNTLKCKITPNMANTEIRGDNGDEGEKKRPFGRLYQQ